MNKSQENAFHFWFIFRMNFTEKAKSLNGLQVYSPDRNKWELMQKISRHFLFRANFALPFTAILCAGFAIYFSWTADRLQLVLLRLEIWKKCHLHHLTFHNKTILDTLIWNSRPHLTSFRWPSKNVQVWGWKMTLLWGSHIFPWLSKDPLLSLVSPRSFLPFRSPPLWKSQMKAVQKNGLRRQSIHE